MSAMLDISTNLDIVARTALGALHFIDAATKQPVTEGLSVIVRIRDKAIHAQPSRQGAYLFHHLPGMTTASFWDGEVAQIPSASNFNIEVRDTLQRFFPVAFEIRLPAWAATPACPEIAVPGTRVTLYSTPWRMARGNFALIRGTLVEKLSKKPAAWAQLRAYRATDSQAAAIPLVKGISGPNGEFALMFPFSKPDPVVMGGSQALRWKVRITARYNSPNSSLLPDEEKQLPSLCSILKQKPATLLESLNANNELPEQEIIPGQTLLLKTNTGSPKDNNLYLTTT